MDRAKNALDQFEIDADRAQQELVSVDMIRKKTESDLAAAEAQIVEGEMKLAKVIEKIPTLNEKIEQNVVEMNELKKQEEDLLDDIANMEQERDQQDLTQRSLKRQIDTFREPAQVFRSKLQQLSQTGNYVVKRGARDTLSAMDWLDEEKQRGRFGSVLGPVGMLMKVNDPAVACMVELAVGEVSLMGFIARNEREGREMRAEMQQRGLQVDVDTMTNDTLDRPIIPAEYLQQFRDIGIKGYIGDQVECEPVVRAWLYQWKKLHMIMWGRTDASSTSIDESHYHRLCSAQHNASVFRLYVHEDNSSSSSSSRASSSSSSSSGRRGGGGYQLKEYAGRRSRYNPGAPPSTSMQVHSSRNGATLLFNDADAGGEDRANHKSHLMQQHAQAQTAYRELEDQVREKKDEIRGVREQMQPLKDTRFNLQRMKRMPEELTAKIKSDKRKRDEIKTKLTKSGESERASLRAAFVRVVDAYLEGVTEGLVSGQMVLARQVEVAAARHFVNVLEDELNDAQEVSTLSLSPVPEPNPPYHSTLTCPTLSKPAIPPPDIPSTSVNLP